MPRTATVKRLTFPEGRRVLAISDIHGNLPFLKGVLAAAHYGPDDILVLVGDLVEKGPDSLTTLRFIMELAQKNPGINYIGIERYSSVLLRGLQKRAELELDNIFFMCIDAKTLADVFAPGEVNRIYLNFSDPWPKDRHAKRRLTSPAFMGVYGRILAPGGTVEFKTDNRELFEYSLESIPDAGWEITEYTFDLHNSPMAEGNVMTEYEMKFASEGKPICKLIARRTGTFGQDPA